MAPAPKTVARSALAIFFEYDTPKIVHIRSKKIGIFSRLIQLTIIGYIIGFALVYKKGYQETDRVQSAVTTKVKGIIFTNDTRLGTRTWDVADYVIPPQESNAFFVMTNVIPTRMQHQGYCPEDPTIPQARCPDNAYCEQLAGTILSPKGNGPIAPECINSTRPGFQNVTVCKIYGWCEVEDDSPVNTTGFEASRNFTVFIKNNIEFPKFDVSRRNLPEKENDTYLSSCHYHSGSSRDKYCPIFTLDSIVNGAHVKFEDIAVEGGVIQIVIDWTCNLDYSVDECLPEYSFRRLDKGDYSISRGFNFRYADHFMIEENGTAQMYRNLYKATGIRFLITVQGIAGQFGILPFLMNIGSGLGLLGITTVICDFFVLYVLKARKFYKKNKYLDVKGQDAFEVLQEESEDERMGSSGEVKRRNLNKSDYGTTSRNGEAGSSP